jgi:hypothetical protein
VSVSFQPWAQNPAFVGAILVTLEAPPNLLGNYHLAACPGSPACNLGAASKPVPSYQGPPATLAAPATDIDDQARPALGGFDAGADEFAASAPPPPPPPPTSNFYFSTAGNTNPPTRPTCPAVGGTADDADIYNWSGTCFSRTIDVTAAPYNLPTSANVDGYSRVDATHFYMSFTGNVNVPGLGTVADEDVVYWNGSMWTLWYDGSAHGLTFPVNLFVDLGATSVVGNTLYFSTNNSISPPGAGGSGASADIYRWNTATDTYTRVVDASTAPYNLTGTPNIDGLVYVDATHFYVSFSATNTAVPGLGNVQDEDIVYFDGTSWSVFFDGTSVGLTDPNQDIDAISFTGTAAAPPAPPAPPTAPALPTLTLRDNFNRTNANNLGGNWSQITVGGIAALRVNSNQAYAQSNGWAMWNGAGNVFGAKQGAAFTFVNTSSAERWLILKGSGGIASTPANYISIRYASGAVTVATTNDAGNTSSTKATFTGPNATFASGDRITALADASGNVFVWKTSGATTTYVGGVTIPTSGGYSWTQGTGSGRIGLLLPTGARVDDFSGGTVP